jgi:hypothetical protein
MATSQPTQPIQSNNSIKNFIFGCGNSDILTLAGVLMLMGVLTLLVEFSRNILTTGIITSMAIILISLLFFGTILLFDIYSIIKKGTTTTDPYGIFAFVLVFINILINVISMIAFMSIFFPPEIIKKVNERDVFSYISKMLTGFLGVLCIYLFFNYYIYSQLKCKNNTNIPTIIILLLIFAFTECVIQILLIIMINSYLHKLTDG